MIKQETQTHNSQEYRQNDAKHTNNHDSEVKTFLDRLSVQLLRQIRKSNARSFSLAKHQQKIFKVN